MFSQPTDEGDRMKEPMTLDRLDRMTREQLCQVDVGQLAEAALGAGLPTMEVWDRFKWAWTTD